MNSGAGSMLDPELKKRLGPEEFGSLLTWCENKPCQIRLRGWLDGGDTHAVQAVVLIDDGYPTRKGVLKYCPSRITPKDFLAFEQAAASGPPGFAKKHLVALDRAVADGPITKGSNGLFLLMGWGAGGRDDFDTMASLLGREVLPLACETIIKSTLVEWNNVKRSVEERSAYPSARNFLQEIVGTRCAADGPITAAVKKLGQSPSESYIHGSSGGLCANPISAVNSGEWISEMSVVGIRGNAHGDLHPDNILIPRPRDGRYSAAAFRRYALIDLSTFGANRLLAVDPAHLLLSIVAREFKKVPPGARRGLSRLILAPEDGESGGIPGELADTVRGIRRAESLFTERSSLEPEWRAESTLAVAGCALLFVGRHADEEAQQWFLELAGMAIDAFRNPRTVARENGKLPTSQFSDAASPSDVPLTPDSDTVQTSSALVPLQDTTTAPPQVPNPVINVFPQIIQQRTMLCSALADELDSEISSLEVGIPAATASDNLFTVSDIIDDLSTAITEMLAWSNADPAAPSITFSTAIENTRLRLRYVTEAVAKMSGEGITPSVQDGALSAVGRLKRSISEILSPYNQ